MTHPDAGMRSLMFEQWKQLRALLMMHLEEEWEWEEDVENDYRRMVSRISYTITGVNIFKKEDWSKLISFF